MTDTEDATAEADGVEWPLSVDMLDELTAAVLVCVQVLIGNEPKRDEGSEASLPLLKTALALSRVLREHENLHGEIAATLPVRVSQATIATALTTIHKTLAKIETGEWSARVKDDDRKTEQRDVTRELRATVRRLRSRHGIDQVTVGNEPPPRPSR